MSSRGPASAGVNLFDLVIFDFDGTLADSARGIAACMRAAFESFGLQPPSPASVRSRIGLTLEESIRQLTTDAPAVDVGAVARRYRQLHVTVAAPAIVAYPGTSDTLAMLHSAGITLAVVSQKGRAGLVQLLAQLSIETYFDLVLGGDDVVAPKPQAALYEHHVATRFPPIARDRVLVVGDTATDLQFAANAGTASCWAEYGYGDRDRCRALNPRYTIPDITAVTSVCGVGAMS